MRDIARLPEKSIYHPKFPADLLLLTVPSKIEELKMALEVEQRKQEGAESRTKELLSEVQSLAEVRGELAEKDTALQGLRACMQALKETAALEMKQTKVD